MHTDENLDEGKTTVLQIGREVYVTYRERHPSPSDLA